MQIRNFVKPVKDYLVWNVTANAATIAAYTVIDEPTENQETGIEVGAAMLGCAVMFKTKARTDQVIESIADWRQNRKTAKTVAEVVA